MNLTVRYVGLTDPGRVRKTNEDNWTADTEQGLFIVADGMGGEFAGALASEAVVETLPGLVWQYLGKMESLSTSGASRRLANAITTLSTQLRNQTQKEPGLAGMGSTVVCVLVWGDQILLAHMGDSRAYRFRAGRLLQLTTDHTLTQLLFDSGHIKPENSSTHPACGQLTRSVGMEGEPLPQTRILKLKAGDLLLLCTDGLTGMLSDAQIGSILKKPESLKARCRDLIAAANCSGGKDNVTVLALAFEREKKQKATFSGADSRCDSGSNLVNAQKCATTNKHEKPSE